MKMIKVTSLKGRDFIYINVDSIGHLYTVPEKISYGSVDEIKHTVIGTTCHNNGGFRVTESVEEILKLIEKSQS